MVTYWLRLLEPSVTGVPVETISYRDGSRHGNWSRAECVTSRHGGYLELRYLRSRWVGQWSSFFSFRKALNKSPLKRKEGRAVALPALPQLLALTLTATELRAKQYLKALRSFLDPFSLTKASTSDSLLDFSTTKSIRLSRKPLLTVRVKPASLSTSLASLSVLTIPLTNRVAPIRSLE